MSIDAIINKVTPDGEDLVLELMSRENPGDRGQPELTIKNFTHTPVPGQAIWGGSGSVIIEPGEGIEEQRHYKRGGTYTMLFEDFRDGATEATSEI